MSEDPGDSAIRVGDCNADQRPSTRIGLALSDMRNEDTTSIRLNDYIDPDALDMLFASRHDGTERDEGRVSFDVASYHVTVRSSGLYTIEPTN